MKLVHITCYFSYTPEKKPPRVILGGLL